MNNATHPTLTRRPTARGKPPDDFNPLHRFAARYALQAICDYFWPSQTLSMDEWLSAKEFVFSPDGQHLIRELQIPVTRVRQVLGAVASKTELAEIRRKIERIIWLRQQIVNLRQQHGPFNVWPAAVRRRYERITRELRCLENGGQEVAS